MKIQTKLIILLAIPALSLAFLGGRALLESHNTVQEMDDIAEMSNLSVRLSAFVHETQKERGCTAVFLSSAGKRFQAELTKQRTETDKQREVLDEFLSGFSPEQQSDAFLQQYESAILAYTKLDEMRDKVSTQSISIGEALSYYTSMHAVIFDALGTMSLDIQDSDLALQNNAYISFLKSKERAGIERAILSATFTNDKFAPGHYAKAIRLISEQNTYMHEFRLYASEDANQFLDKALAHETVGQVQEMRDVAFENASAGGFGIDASQWFDTITVKINQLKSVDDYLAQQLSESAAERRTAAAWSRVVLCVVLIGVLGIIGIAGLVITRSITRRLVNIKERIRDIAEGEGDLTQRIDASSKDEVGELGKWFNAFISKIHDVIVDVAGASSEVAAASTEIAASADQIASGMNEQSQQITTVSSAVEEMSASVVEVARKSADAANSANESGRIATEGGDVVADTITGMASINEAVSTSAKSVQELGKRGEQIGEVITVINDIADQTNLLALNAAIEAARAGEHGRGFAVVADEVRKLADRTTKATEEIGGSIQAIQTETTIAVDKMNAGTNEVSTGVEKAQQAGDSLQQIVASAQDVSTMVQSIAAAAEEQSAASEEVSRNIEQIASVTRQTSEGTSQAADAATQLSQRAETLQQLVGQFKTDRG